MYGVTLRGPASRLCDSLDSSPSASEPAGTRDRPEDDWLGLVTGGWYAASLEPFLDGFGEQVLVLVHDDIVRDPHGVFGQAVRHVGAAPGVVPDTLDEVVFSNRDATRSVPQLSDSERSELFEYFRADVERLERLLGRDLSVWRPDASTP